MDQAKICHARAHGVSYLFLTNGVASGAVTPRGCNGGSAFFTHPPSVSKGPRSVQRSAETDGS